VSTSLFAEDAEQEPSRTITTILCLTQAASENSQRATDN